MNRYQCTTNIQLLKWYSSPFEQLAGSRVHSCAEQCTSSKPALEDRALYVNGHPFGLWWQNYQLLRIMHMLVTAEEL